MNPALKLFVAIITVLYFAVLLFLGKELGWPADSQMTVLGIAALTVLNLFLLTKVIARFLEFMSEKKQQNQTIAVIRFVSWSVLKLACLGLLVWTLFESGHTPTVAKLISVSALVVIPLAAGLFWSWQQERGLRT